jgi:hypothetical protein
MLYPNEGEAAQRRAFAAHYLAEPIRRFEAAGGALAYNDLSRIVKDGGARLDVIGERPAGRFKASDRLGETVGGKGASVARASPSFG